MTLTVAPGDALPSVGLRASDGYLLNLRSFVTKQPAVLVFFGAPTLKGAARRRGLQVIEALEAGHERLREAGIAVVGISTDSEEQQRAFVAERDLPFLLLSDERRSAVEVLGVETSAEGENVNIPRPLAIAVDRDGIVITILDPAEPETLVDTTLRALSVPLPVATGDAAAER